MTFGDELRGNGLERRDTDAGLACPTSTITQQHIQRLPFCSERPLAHVTGVALEDEPPQASALRRLWFEAHVMTVGDLRQL